MTRLPSHARRRLVDQATADVLLTRRLLEPAMALIFDSLAGHPRAVRYDGDPTGAGLWCFVHERDHRCCERDGLACGGTPIVGADPTGEAAVGADRAAQAQARIDHAVTALADAAKTLAVELAAWSPPSTDMQRPDPASASAPEGWCRSCWRDNRYHEPVGIRPGGTAPYYRDLCEWCGRFRAAEGYLPPVELLRKRHSPNPRISEADVARHRPPGHRS